MTKVKWLNVTIDNGAWLYCGTAECLNEAFVFNSINMHFASESLYVAWTRNESIEVNKRNIKNSVKHILGLHDFSIWDSDFNRVMEFNKTGVFRLGVLEI